MPDNIQQDPQVIRAQRPARPEHNPFEWVTHAQTVNLNDLVQQQILMAEAVPSIKPKAALKNPTLLTVYEQFRPEVIDSARKAMEAHKPAMIYGLELEIEAWPVNTHDLRSTGFSFTEDGSLRNNGYEAVSSPNSKQGILAVTKELWSKYGITSEKNFSDRTSIHVHTNCLDYTFANMQALAVTYMTLEDLIFTFIGEDRRKNIFCVPWSEARIPSGVVPRLFENIRGWHKYTALNLLPLRTQGTVEWRHMEGHADYQRLEAWLTIIEEIMWYAKTHTGEEVIKSIQDLNSTSEYSRWVHEVLPKSSALFTEKLMREKLTRGVIEAKLISFSF